MREADKKGICVQISNDAMAAYLTLLKPLPDETYTVHMINQVLQEKGIVHGIREEAIEQIIADKLYDADVQVASGTPVVEGQDGVYEYNFKQNPNKKPLIREDGSVDYWSMHLIETVVKDQVIAIYKPAVAGTDGKTIFGKVVPAKLRREQPPLKGRGFVRSNDNLTYIASMDGKIEMVNNRININNFHEIFANVDMVFGNIDFAGDVVIHGNVCSGMSVKAGGTLTVDGVVEGASLWAGKDIVLRGGVLGDNKAEIFAKGDICAKFFEYAKIEAYGTIVADALLQCEVECRKNVTLEGKHGVIVGGHIHAIGGVEVNEIGNESEVKGIVEVGFGEQLYQEMNEVRQNLQELHENIQKMKEGLRRFDELGEARGISYKDDPRRTAVLRAMIRDNSMEKMNQVRMEELRGLEETAVGASVKVNRKIYPGTMIVIGKEKKYVKEEQIAVEYVKRNDGIVLKGEALVE